MFCAYWFESAVALRMAPAHLPADSVQVDQIDRGHGLSHAL